MVTVAVKRPGECWERHVVARFNLEQFLRNLERQGVKYRRSSP